MTVKRLRMTMVVMEILDAISSAIPDDPPWGFRLCDQTRRGPATIYPALDRLEKAGWITAWWEEPQPADRPRRRFYGLTEEGREAHKQAVAAWEARRSAWKPTWIQP